MTCATVSVLTASGSISMPSEASQLGQLYDRATRDFAPGYVAVSGAIRTVSKLFLQYGHKLMDSPSFVGCGVEIASYREGASAHTASHGSVLASGEGHNHAHRTGRHRLALLPLQRTNVGLSPRPHEGKAPPTGPDHLDDVSVGIPQ